MCYEFGYRPGNFFARAGAHRYFPFLSFTSAIQENQGDLAGDGSSRRGVESSISGIYLKPEFLFEQNVAQFMSVIGDFRNDRGANRQP
jgi:hypothetical protein